KPIDIGSHLFGLGKVYFSSEAPSGTSVRVEIIIYTDKIQADGSHSPDYSVNSGWVPFTETETEFEQSLFPKQPNMFGYYGGPYRYFMQYRVTLSTVPSSKQKTSTFKGLRVELKRQGDGISSDPAKYPNICDNWPGWYVTAPSFTVSALDWYEVNITLNNALNPISKTFVFESGETIPVITNVSPSTPKWADLVFTEGTNTVSTWAKDISGNSSFGDTVEIYYDKTPPLKPVFKITSASNYDAVNNVYYMKNPVVNFDIEVDDADGQPRRLVYNSNINKTLVSPGDSSWSDLTAKVGGKFVQTVTSYPLNEGSNLIYARCCDQAGNKSNLAFVNIFVDTIKPKSYNNHVIHSNTTPGTDFALPGHATDGVVLMDDKVVLSKWLYQNTINNAPNVPNFISSDSKYIYMCDASGTGGRIAFTGKLFDAIKSGVKTAFKMPDGTPFNLKEPIAVVPYNDKLFILDRKLQMLFRVKLDKYTLNSFSVIGDTVEAYFGVPDVPSSGPKYLNYPQGLAIYNTDEVYVADTKNNRVLRTNINLTDVLNQYGSVFSGAISEPVAVSADPINIYVAEKGVFGKNRIIQLDKSMNEIQALDNICGTDIMNVSAVSSDGTFIYIGDANNGTDWRISKYQTKPVMTFVNSYSTISGIPTPENFSGITSIFADGEDIYFTEGGNKRSVKTSSVLWKYKGQFPTGTTSAVPPGNDANHMNIPTALCADSSYLYALNYHPDCNGLVSKIRSSLVFSTDNKKVYLESPTGIAASKDYFYLVNPGGFGTNVLRIWAKDLVQTFNYDNEAVVPKLLYPIDVYAYKEAAKYMIYVADYQANTIYKYQEFGNGQIIRVSQSAAGKIIKPVAIAVDDTGVYVLQADCTIVKLNPDMMSVATNLGKEIRFGVSGVTGFDDTHLNTNPQTTVSGAVAYSKLYSTGSRVYVSDTNNHRVIKFDNYLNYKGEIGKRNEPGIDKDHFNLPSGIASLGGDIYVNDTNNNRMVKTGNDNGVYTSAWVNVGSHILKVAKLN
ncbi:MAG TPA: hypothetical protein PKK26_16040, partial [Candidatus Wallbacteria bacterium]|nr:hypothetical protein [Candidatus Wallbacteria bacterium]